jgi:hypothetical protein
MYILRLYDGEEEPTMGRHSYKMEGPEFDTALSQAPLAQPSPAPALASHPPPLSVSLLSLPYNIIYLKIDILNALGKSCQ